MFEKQISKDADKLLCVLYKSYLEKRKEGIPKSDAKKFWDSSDIQQEFFPKESIENVDETCKELLHANYISGTGAEDMLGEIELLDPAIVHMENRFKSGLSEVVDFLLKLKQLKP